METWDVRTVNRAARRRAWLAGILLAGLALQHVARAADINFAVQPVIPQDQIKAAYQPMADYIAKATGKSVKLFTAYDFAQFWLTMKEGKTYNLILDSPFYTDYRLKHMGYTLLVKAPGVVSYSLVSLPDPGYFGPSDLVGKKIASLIPPSPGYLLVAKMFPNPTRQPIIIPVRDSTEAIEALKEHKADAAMVPTPVVGRLMNNGTNLLVIKTSEQFPHIALSAAPSIDAATRKAITDALLNANKTAAGKAMLKKIGLSGFEKATPAMYDGYSKYLEEGWLK